MGSLWRRSQVDLSGGVIHLAAVSKERSATLSSLPAPRYGSNRSLETYKQTCVLSHEDVVGVSRQRSPSVMSEPSCACTISWRSTKPEMVFAFITLHLQRGSHATAEWGGVIEPHSLPSETRPLITEIACTFVNEDDEHWRSLTELIPTDHMKFLRWWENISEQIKIIVVLNLSNILLIFLTFSFFHNILKIKDTGNSASFYKTNMDFYYILS